MVFSFVQMFIRAENDLQFVAGFTVMIIAIVFMLFGFLEERNEEISELRNTIRQYHKLLLIEDEK